jgi:hypothetical protein
MHRNAFRTSNIFPSFMEIEEAAIRLYTEQG